VQRQSGQGEQIVMRPCLVSRRIRRAPLKGKLTEHSYPTELSPDITLANSNGTGSPRVNT
jgi:hypothetical protein